MSDFDSDLRWVWYRETVCRVPNSRMIHCECGKEVWDYYVNPNHPTYPLQSAICRDCFDKEHRPKDDQK